MSNRANGEAYFSPNQASKLMGLSGRQIRRMCFAGRLKGAHQMDPTNPKSNWLIPYSAIEEFLRLREAQANR